MQSRKLFNAISNHLNWLIYTIKGEWRSTVSCPKRSGVEPESQHIYLGFIELKILQKKTNLLYDHDLVL